MMIHFIRPLWLIALLPAIMYVIWVIYSYKQDNPWKKVCDPHLLSALLQPTAHKSRLIFNSTLFLFFTLCIAALAGPAWNKAKLPVFRDVSSLMLVLDLSSAMQAMDLKPDRLTRAKFKIRDLINTAPNTQMGLVVFTDEAFVVSPLSQDANTLSSMLDELYPQMMPVAGSDSGQGLAEALTLMKQANAEHGNILLITASEPTAYSWTVAKNISQTGGHLNILAMLESNSNTEATITKLQQLAKLGDGSFYLFTPEGLDIQTILSRAPDKQVIKDNKIEDAYLWKDAGPWFCLLLIPFALIVLREKMQHEKHH
jgi:Ca-activated chloride channel homolog